ncbi:hypothetical protein Q7C_2730 (plasmid) [Methylophaga frappieri]|jgi:hypothetical protein|uniref:Peptidase n=1 Tax=Methylophaga frappieri (strain ATCC BAA-2434 / DSM 25690 / JAM7) TaxID=754477 RepID=I1YLQ7_METFJ|nr:hypothetical protein [Methylophaga frappieri]AFJ03850.1 hypothetical protein Q7C_2730 [Methylophaga frappieri]
MKKVSSLSGIFDLLRPISWIALISLLALSSRAISYDWLLLAALWLALAVSAGVWAIQQPWIKEAKRPFERHTSIALSILLIPILAYIVALASGVILERISAARYDKARIEFMTDPDGFPFIKNFALEHYGAHVVLTSPVSGWTTSSFPLPHASAAFMAIGPGFCELTLNQENVLRGFSGDDPGLWVKGVMIHELAHCLDISRDMPSFTNNKIGIKSIAPTAAGNVVDLESHIEAANGLATKRWREALADVFAVGYWRMVEPSANKLVADLKEKRRNGATAHTTSCWIQYAANAPLPDNLSSLLSWADEIRTTAHCALQHKRS